MKPFLWGLLLSGGLLLVACGATAAPEPTGSPTFALSSPAFAGGEAIPRRYSCDGPDLSPPLEWADPPAGTQGFVLVMDDPDAPAGTWVHWVWYDIPADLRALPEGVPAEAEPASGGRQGKNSWGRLGYGGPCPPDGTQRYFFRLYALDTLLDLEPGEDRDAVLAAMEGHVLGWAELLGTYSRPP